MTIYQFRAETPTSSGSTSATSLRIGGGICRQVRIVANTSSTTFLSYIQDDKNFEVMRYSSQTGELNDITAFPVQGTYTVYITNASPDDTFKIYLAVEE